MLPVAVSTTLLQKSMVFWYTYSPLVKNENVSHTVLFVAISRTEMFASRYSFQTTPYSLPNFTCSWTNTYRNYQLSYLIVGFPPAGLRPLVGESECRAKASVAFRVNDEQTMILSTFTL